MTDTDNNPDTHDTTDLLDEHEAAFQRAGRNTSSNYAVHRMVVPGRSLPRLVLREALTPEMRRSIERNTSLSVLITVPSEDWVRPIADCLKTMFGKHELLVLTTNNGTRQTSEEHMLHEFLAALAAGRRVAAIAQNPALDLPKAVVASADLTITLPAPSGRLIARAIRLATGKRVRSLPDDAASGLTFVDLCAAIRPGTTPDQCVARLQRASRAKSVTDAALADVPSVENLYGYGKAKAWAQALLADLQLWRAGEIAFTDIEARVLLGSAPGLGKTTFARSLAKSAGLPLIASSVGQWFSGDGNKGNLGDVIRQIDAVFDAAASAAPSILFLDELDALPDRRALNSRNRDWWMPVVNHMLTKLDGAVSAQARDLIIIGATNYPDLLDPALLRPGRLSKTIRIGHPSPAELAGIFRQHLGKDLQEADLSLVARLARGATGADVAGWVKSARRIARQERRALHLDDLLMLVAPAEQRRAAEVQRVAIHEAAHAVIGHALGRLVASEISIIARGNVGGYSAWQGVSSSLQTRADLEAHIQTLLAGRCAEIAVFGQASSGAGGDQDSDLGRATKLVTFLETGLGLGATLTFRSGYETTLELLSSDAQLRTKVETRLQHLHKATLKLVNAHRGQILKVAEELVQQRCINGDRFRQLLTEDVT